VGSVHRLVAAVDAELGLQVARMDADGVHREEQLIGDLGSREVGRQVAQHPDLAEGELFIQAAAANPSRLAAGRRRGPVPGEQALDLGDQGGVGRAVPGAALEQARRGGAAGKLSARRRVRRGRARVPGGAVEDRRERGVRVALGEPQHLLAAGAVFAV